MYSIACFIALSFEGCFNQFIPTVKKVFGAACLISFNGEGGPAIIKSIPASSQATASSTFVTFI